MFPCRLAYPLGARCVEQKDLLQCGDQAEMSQAWSQVGVQMKPGPKILLHETELFYVCFFLTNVCFFLMPHHTALWITKLPIPVGRATKQMQTRCLEAALLLPAVPAQGRW